MTLVRRRGPGHGRGRRRHRDRHVRACSAATPRRSSRTWRSSGLTPANVNGAGQIVAAGTAEQLAALAEDKPEGVRRVVAAEGRRRLPHRTTWPPRSTTLAGRRRALDGRRPDARRTSPTRTARSVADGAEVSQRLVGQVANPVRWDLCMETFKELGVTALIEVCPGGTLTGLAKRALPGVQTLALKTPDDLDAARELDRRARLPRRA